MSPSQNQAPLPRELVTISVPVLNEEGNIDQLLQRLAKVARANTRYPFEFLFTDDASTDATFGALARLAANGGRIRGLRFSRNFGFYFDQLSQRQRASCDPDRC
jgi:polyisoprenyl-phosphate glycosyltransferase